MRGTRQQRPLGRILADDVLHLAPTPAGQRARMERAAALTVAERAHDRADVALLLEALGMLPYEHAARPWDRAPRQDGQERARDARTGHGGAERPGQAGSSASEAREGL